MFWISMRNPLWGYVVQMQYPMVYGNVTAKKARAEREPQFYFQIMPL